MMTFIPIMMMKYIQWKRHGLVTLLVQGDLEYIHQVFRFWTINIYIKWQISTTQNNLFLTQCK